MFWNRKISSSFIRSLVGLDRQAVQEAFSKYLQGSTYNEKQIRFVEMLIEHLTQNGVLDASQLYEPPFNQIHYEGLMVCLVMRMLTTYLGLLKRLMKRWLRLLNR